MSDKNITRVMYEYEDGSKAFIEGKYLEMWLDAIGGMETLAYTHGMLPEKTFTEIWDNARREE